MPFLTSRGRCSLVTDSSCYGQIGAFYCDITLSKKIEKSPSLNLPVFKCWPPTPFLSSKNKVALQVKQYTSVFGIQTAGLLQLPGTASWFTTSGLNRLDLGNWNYCFAPTRLADVKKSDKKKVLPMTQSSGKAPVRLLVVAARMATLERKPALPYKWKARHIFSPSSPVPRLQGNHGKCTPSRLCMNAHKMQSIGSRRKLDTNQKPNDRGINKRWDIHGAE